MNSAGRNSPCPCGSGKRYKECHGALPADATTPRREAFDVTPGLLQEAAKHFEAGNFIDAERLYGKALEATPNHPEALRLLGRCVSERGDATGALLKLVAAARAMQSYPLSPSAQYAVWTDLNFMFTQALSGMDIEFASHKRAEYRVWQNALPRTAGNIGALVSVVLVFSEPSPWIAEALASVCAQTYPRIELVVVSGERAPDAEGRITRMLRDCPFPCRVLAMPGASEPSMINAGVRASTGEFVNVLDGLDQLPASRIEVMTRAVTGRGLAWGFSNVDFIVNEDGSVDAGRDAAISGWRELLGGMAEVDTVGFALIHQIFVVVAVGNLFFSRKLFDAVGGFNEMPHVYAWDFCLRAVWLEEPAFVSSAEYRHRVLSTADATAHVRQEAEAAQVAMFVGFYAKACEGLASANPHAPSLFNWRMQFLKTAFQVGHVLAFPLDRLEEFAGQIVDRRKAAASTVSLPGVNLVGFAFGEFGLAENLRALVKSCILGHIPFVVRDVDMRLKTRQADRTLGPYVVDELRHAGSVFCLNPDMLKPIRHLMVSTGSVPRYNIGFWFWELEHIPREWAYAIDSVDEIWVATEFVRKAMQTATSKPVIKVPTPIEVALPRAYTRAEFALPEDRFLFHFSFDFNSFIMRKNPEGAIKAFKSAFANGRQDVGLVVKSINGTHRPERLREMQALIDGDERIVITDGFLSREQVFGLESVVDAYVSLHRAEGLGLGMAESMYLGKPVIATAYSGNLEFMNADNSCLVDYRLIPIRKGEYLYDDERYRWAEPDLAQAADWMVRLVDDVEFRTRIAQRGQHDVRTRFSHANAAALMRDRLEEIGLL
jgi:glycosyltransferase involved in cell wall biosynthesis